MLTLIELAFIDNSEQFFLMGIGKNQLSSFILPPVSGKDKMRIMRPQVDFFFIA